jgi:DMSO/TMAO reductase YedYZ molybdopterin-dependent catalytic subunit
VAFATGVGAVASGTAAGRWVVIGHGAAGFLVVLLVPWKARVVRAGLRRVRPSRWFSLLLATLAVGVLGLGFAYSTGVVRSIGGFGGLWLHVAVAAGAGYAVTTAVVETTGLPGARRRFTGSYERGSFNPDAMPNTIRLDDTAPDLDAATWRLTVVDSTGRRELTLPDLRTGTVTRRVLLDCTSGWYAEQDWTGVPVRDLFGRVGETGGETGGKAGREARSLLVHSRTGYRVRLPVADLDHLLLATGVGGGPLTRGHGCPLRLVAPGRRGFWWVKWVDRVELSTTPWWWQSPFPVT